MKRGETDIVLILDNLVVVEVDANHKGPKKGCVGRDSVKPWDPFAGHHKSFIALLVLGCHNDHVELRGGLIWARSQVGTRQKRIDRKKYRFNFFGRDSWSCQALQGSKLQPHALWIPPNLQKSLSPHTTLLYSHLFLCALKRIITMGSIRRTKTKRMTRSVIDVYSRTIWIEYFPHARRFWRTNIWFLYAEALIKSIPICAHLPTYLATRTLNPPKTYQVWVVSTALNVRSGLKVNTTSCNIDGERITRGDVGHWREMPFSQQEADAATGLGVERFLEASKSSEGQTEGVQGNVDDVEMNVWRRHGGKLNNDVWAFLCSVVGCEECYQVAFQRHSQPHCVCGEDSGRWGLCVTAGLCENMWQNRIMWYQGMNWKRPVSAFKRYRLLTVEQSKDSRLLAAIASSTKSLKIHVDRACGREYFKRSYGRIAQSDMKIRIDREQL